MGTRFDGLAIANLLGETRFNQLLTLNYTSGSQFADEQLEGIDRMAMFKNATVSEPIFGLGHAEQLSREELPILTFVPFSQQHEAKYLFDEARLPE